jgi:DmsE family decaheme c-type cytochrome
MKQLAALLTFVLLILGGSVAAQEAGGRTLGNSKDTNACINCHDTAKVTSILHTAHGVKGDPRTEVSTEGCQSCHGDSSAHMIKPPEGQLRAPPSVIFSGPRASPVAERNKVCIGCHEGGIRMHWQGSQHETSDIACTNCHTSHAVEDAVLSKRTQGPVCFTCHAEQRAANLKPSHHPVIEGLVACSDCHNPHGSTTRALLKGATVNDTCTTCHDEKRGPFLWEHAPVQEDCTICHTPHGSIQASLLKQRIPYLCQDCHDSSLHESQPFSGASIAGGANPSRVMVLRACLNCHTEVHGSNHPSGPRLER